MAPPGAVGSIDRADGYCVLVLLVPVHRHCVGHTLITLLLRENAAPLEVLWPLKRATVRHRVASPAMLMATPSPFR